MAQNTRCSLKPTYFHGRQWRSSRCARPAMAMRPAAPRPLVPSPLPPPSFASRTPIICARKHNNTAPSTKAGAPFKQRWREREEKSKKMARCDTRAHVPWRPRQWRAARSGCSALTLLDAARISSCCSSTFLYASFRFTPRRSLDEAPCTLRGAELVEQRGDPVHGWCWTGTWTLRAGGGLV